MKPADMPDQTEPLLRYNRTVRKSNLARNLLVARKALGLTQVELAESSGYSRLTVLNLENGTGDPRLSTVTDLATVLGISPLLLLMTPEELVAVKKISSKLRTVRKKLDDETAAYLGLIYFATTKDLLKGVELALKSVKGEDKSVSVGVAIGTGCKPGEGTEIGMALGELWKPK